MFYSASYLHLKLEVFRSLRKEKCRPKLLSCPRVSYTWESKQGRSSQVVARWVSFSTNPPKCLVTSLFSNGFIEIPLTFLKIHPFKEYHSMVFNIFTVVQPSLQYNFITFSSPQKKPHAHWHCICLLGLP